jgi:PilZ domain
MYLYNRLAGRKERRLPIVVAVNLAPLEPRNAERHERTYTDNISPHGARVRSTHAWRLGDLAEITPVSGETPVHGEVVYCQKLDNDRFFVGFKVRVSRILWSILLRFDGIDMMEFDDTDTVKCKFCGSDEQKKLRAEIAIHVPDINKPHVFVFPELLVCRHCGKAEFVMPEDQLRLLMK